MRIELLGDNCRACQRLKGNIELALQSFTTKPSLQFVNEPERFAEYGLMSLPALAVDGEIKAAGQMLSIKEIMEVLTNH